MGRDQAAVRPVFRGIFDRANEALGEDLKSLCFEGPQASLDDTVNTQPAIYTHSVAAFELVMMSGEVPAPDFVAGHSLGEFSALCVAGALQFEDGLQLVRSRGKLMKQAGESLPGSMAAVIGADMAAVVQVCALASEQSGGLGVVPANDNCPGQIVISGTREAVAAAIAIARANGIKRVIPLAVSIASHSPLMAGISREFARLVASTSVQTATIPVVANTSVAIITHPDDIRAELVAQLTSPVRWTETVQFMHRQGVTNFYELGPKDVLSNLLKRTIPDGITSSAIG